MAKSRRSGALGLCILLLHLVLGIAAFVWVLTSRRSEAIRLNENEVYRALGRLHNAGGSLSTFPDLRAADPGAPTPVPYHGYFFRAVDPGEDRGRFFIWAWPVEHGATGRHTYFANGGGIFRKDRGGGYPDPLPALKELRTTWSIID